MRLAFGDYLIVVDRRQFSRGGEPVRLLPQVFDLIAFLAHHHDRVVTRTELFEAVWGARFVTDSALRTRINAARKALGDDGETQAMISTIPRRGFRFVAKVVEQPVSQATGAAIDIPSHGAASPGPLQLPDKPSIAVLPFQNLSGDPGQEYFADGMVEEITTALARIRWLFVIARNSAFTYKGKTGDVKQIGRELGVRYVVEGSVRKSGDRVRITAQLIEAEEAMHLWADRFDGALDDVFDLQDRVAAGVAAAIEPKLLLAEIDRTSKKAVPDLRAYDLYLRALAQFHRFTGDSLVAAATVANEALAIDPGYGRAAALAGFACATRAPQLNLTDAETAEAVRLARQAVETAADDPEALWMAGYTVSALAGDHATAAGWIDRSLALNPNAAFAWNVRGWVAALRGEPTAAIEFFQHAMRLSPFDPLGWSFSGGMCFASLAARRFDEALLWADRRLREQPGYGVTLRYKAIACAHLGRIVEARDCVSGLLEVLPAFSIAAWLDGYAATTYSPEIVALFRDGLRRAGAPE